MGKASQGLHKRVIFTLALAPCIMTILHVRQGVVYMGYGERGVTDTD